MARYIFPLSYLTLNPILFLFLPRALSFPSIYIYLLLSFIQFFPILLYSCILFFPILPCQGIVSYFFLSYLELYPIFFPYITLGCIPVFPSESYFYLHPILSYLSFCVTSYFFPLTLSCILFFPFDL